MPAGEFSSVNFIRLSGREENLRCKSCDLVLRSYGVWGLGSGWIIVFVATMLFHFFLVSFAAARLSLFSVFRTNHIAAARCLETNDFEGYGA